jgi:polyisoprenoid-binding protein YceI
MRRLQSSLAQLTAGALVLLVAAGAAHAAQINPASSSIIATFRQEGVPVDAPFKRFSGQIDFDAAHPATGHATLQVATASLDLGSPDYSAEVQKAEWFNCAAFPSASFVSTSITPGAPGHFTANGTFTLKGRSQTLSVPVTVTRTGAVIAYDGTLQISRKYFSIGSADWNDVLDDTVRVRFHLVQ